MKSKRLYLNYVIMIIERLESILLIKETTKNIEFTCTWERVPNQTEKELIFNKLNPFRECDCWAPSAPRKRIHRALALMNESERMFSARILSTEWLQNPRWTAMYTYSSSHVNIKYTIHSIRLAKCKIYENNNYSQIFSLLSMITMAVNFAYCCVALWVTVCTACALKRERNRDGTHRIWLSVSHCKNYLS